jgi:hypothetical protein
MHGRFAIARTVVLAASFFGMFLNKTKELVVFSLHHLFIYFHIHKIQTPPNFPWSKVT